MDLNLLFIALPIIGFLAYIVKCTTGFGTAIVIVSLGSLVMGTHEAVILTALLDTIGGTVLYVMDPVSDGRKFWVPLATAMIVGTVIGAMFLAMIPAAQFDILLGVFITGLGAWFMFSRSKVDESGFNHNIPDRPSGGDLMVSVFSGICGGLFAVGGPPIVYWFGRTYGRLPFRRTLIVVFYTATVARAITYGFGGLIDGHQITLSLIGTPGVLLGIVVGNHVHKRLTEKTFSKLIGIVMFIIGIRLFFK